MAKTTLLRTTQLGIDAARLARHALAGRAEARATAVDRIRVHLTMHAPRPTVETLEVSYASSLDAVKPADWKRLSAQAGHVFRDTRVASDLVASASGSHRQLIGVVCAGGSPSHDRSPADGSSGHSRCCGSLDTVGIQLGPVCAAGPTRRPSQVNEATGAIPLQRFVLLAEQVSVDQRFGELTREVSLYRGQSSAALRARLLGRVLQAEDFLFPRSRWPPRLAFELGTLTYRLANKIHYASTDIRFTLRSSPAALGKRPRHPFYSRGDLAASSPRRRFTEVTATPGSSKQAAGRVARSTVSGLPAPESAYQSGRDPALRQRRRWVSCFSRVPFAKR